MSKKKKSENWGENGFEDWGGYMAAKQAKLEEQFREEANNEVKKSNIFRGMAIFVNGYTDPTADELRHLMISHGGLYHHYMRPKATTHIIASNLPHSKILLYRKSQNPIPICKPEWITDSIKAGRVLNFQNYLLYSHCTDVQPQLKYVIKRKEEKTNATSAIQNNLHVDNEVNSSTNDNNNDASKPTCMNQNTTSSIVSMSTKDAHSSKNSEFISEFYNHSRLHHIATMGTIFKDYVNELRDKSNGHFPDLRKLNALKDLKLNKSVLDPDISYITELFDFQEENKVEISQVPVIMHIDMDCFFVSVGLRDRPDLKGLPVAVTHAKGNKNPASNNKQTLDSNINKDDEHGSLSEIASCSYEARKVGVKNGMFLGEALKICPNLKTISYNFEGYTEVSYVLYDTVASYTLDIEAVSCDEMYADCTNILQESGLTPMEFATVIRQEIKEKTGCPVSTGFGSNKLLARLATRKAKPDGQFYIQQDNVNDCISTLNVQDLPGVGWTTAHKLKSINVRTCAELQTISLATLQKEFGKKTGEILYNMCRGVDNSKLNLEHVRKSVSAEVNYGIRFESNDDAIDFLRKLSREVSNRLNKANAKGRCITLKLLIRAKEAPKETEKFMGHGLCDYMTKSKNLIASINDVDIITKEVITLWNQMQKPPEDARGIGIQISRLEILKSKSRYGTITNFMNKNKQNDKNNPSSPEISKRNNAEPVQSSNIVASVSENATVINEEKYMHIPPESNEPVLSELPEEIRNEILNDNKRKLLVESNKTQETASAQESNKKHVQTRQEDFFKQTKSGISKPGKVEMPSIQEIDMAVLIELPEDIRNEILNEYSVRRNQETNVITNGNACASSTSNAAPVGINHDDQNISFSQIDPEYLAALPDDLRHDVQMYCTAKKSELSAKARKDEINHNTGSTKTEDAKQSKKTEQTVKNKTTSKSGKSTHPKNKKKNVKTGSKAKKNVNVTEKCGIIPSVQRNESVDDHVTADEAQAILSHNRTIAEDNENTDQHQDSLINLVNRLLNLPLEQVALVISIVVDYFLSRIHLVELVKKRESAKAVVNFDEIIW